MRQALIGSVTTHRRSTNGARTRSRTGRVASGPVWTSRAWYPGWRRARCSAPTALLETRNQFADSGFSLDVVGTGTPAAGQATRTRGRRGSDQKSNLDSKRIIISLLHCPSVPSREGHRNCNRSTTAPEPPPHLIPEQHTVTGFGRATGGSTGSALSPRAPAVTGSNRICPPGGARYGNSVPAGRLLQVFRPGTPPPPRRDLSSFGHRDPVASSETVPNTALHAVLVTRRTAGRVPRR